MNYLVSRAEAAKTMRISVATLDTRIANNEINVIRNGRRVWITRDQLDAYVDKKVAQKYEPPLTPNQEIASEEMQEFMQFIRYINRMSIAKGTDEKTVDTNTQNKRIHDAEYLHRNVDGCCAVCIEMAIERDVPIPYARKAYYPCKTMRVLAGDNS